MKNNQANLTAADLDELIEEITVDAHGEDEQLWAFRQTFEDDIAVPCDARVIGEAVQVMKFDYDGNNRRGLTATCRRADGTKHVVAASDVVIPLSAPGAPYLAAYRKWMGLAPLPQGTRGKAGRQPAAPAPDLDGPIELVVLSVKQKAARCRLLGGEGTFTFRAGRLWDVVPGEIAVVRPAKQWTYAGNPYLSGAIESTRLDAKALGLAPLRLEQRGLWNPAEHYWGEEGEPIEDWAKPVIGRGPRPEFEMEQVLPFANPDDPFSDPMRRIQRPQGFRRQRGRVQDPDGSLPGRPSLLGCPLAPGKLRLRPPAQGRNPELRGGISHRRAIPRRTFRRRAAMGSDRQPAFPTLHARLRSVPLAAGPFRRCRAHLRTHALAESVGQPGRPVHDRSGPGEGRMGRVPRISWVGNAIPTIPTDRVDPDPTPGRESGT